MNYYTFTVGNKEYKLRLGTRAVVNLEKRLGKNPIDVFTSLTGNQLPKTTDMMYILHASMEQLNHGVSIDSVYDIYDEYLEEGHTLADFINVVLDVFKMSGLIDDITATEETDTKN